MTELRGIFRVEYKPPPGKPGWASPLFLRNGPTIEGLNYLLEASFRGGAQISIWRVGIINSAGYSAISEDDTIASHVGWSEFTDIASPRPIWSPTAASGGRISASKNLVLTADGVVKGMFLTSSPAIGSPGLLYCHSVDPTGRSVGAGGILDLTYEMKVSGG